MRSVSIALLLLGCGRSSLPIDLKIAEDAGKLANLCGGTQSLTTTPGNICGECGTYVCDGVDTVHCQESRMNACGACGPLPTEQCNGHDDNCDDRIDEGCPVRLPWSNIGSAWHQRISGNRMVVDVLDSGIYLVDLATQLPRLFAANRLTGQSYSGVQFNGEIDGD